MDKTINILKKYFYDNFSTHLDNIDHLSNGEVNSTELFYNFDAITKSIYKNDSLSAKSVDYLAFTNNNAICFVEQKKFNETIHNGETSTLPICDITNTECEKLKSFEDAKTKLKQRELNSSILLKGVESWNTIEQFIAKNLGLSLTNVDANLFIIVPYMPINLKKIYGESEINLSLTDQIQNSIKRLTKVKGIRPIYYNNARVMSFLKFEELINKYHTAI